MYAEKDLSRSEPGISTRDSDRQPRNLNHAQPTEMNLLPAFFGRRAVLLDAARCLIHSSAAALTCSLVTDDPASPSIRSAIVNRRPLISASTPSVRPSLQRCAM